MLSVVSRYRVVVSAHERVASTARRSHMQKASRVAGAPSSALNELLMHFEGPRGEERLVRIHWLAGAMAGATSYLEGARGQGARGGPLAAEA